MRPVDERSDIPWGAINDYLIEVCSLQETDSFIKAALAGIGRVLPYDACAAVCDPQRKIISSIGLTEEVRRSYNDYYRLLAPPFNVEKDMEFPHPDFFSIRIIEYGEYADSEFYTDFAHPNGIEATLVAPAPGSQILLALQRSRYGPGFSEKEVKSLEVINAHLNNHYALLARLAAASADLPTQGSILERFSHLTKCEAEIGRLLCYRLSAPEIASIRFLSVRTVESHIAHLYAKLGVHSKKDAILRLSGGCSYS